MSKLPPISVTFPPTLTSLARDLQNFYSHISYALKYINADNGVTGGAAGVDHALLSHLTYATAGHTGFEASGAAITAVANHVTAYHSGGEFQQTTVAGAMNGVNTTYTLGHALAEPIFIIWNGVKQLSITSYTITSTTLEMAVAPATGDSLEAYGKY